MTHTYEETFSNSSNIIWKGENQGIRYKIMYLNLYFHDHPNFENSGIWCYYIYLSELEINDFNLIRCERKQLIYNEKIRYFYEQPYFFNDIDFHGGITYSGNEFFNHPYHEKLIEQVCIGCDYGHYWDQEAGYPYTFDSVKRDCFNTINQIREKLISMNLFVEQEK